jgi:hypothetical protein
MKKLLIVLAVVSLLVAPAFAAKSNSFEKAIKGEGVDWATQQNIITVNPLVFLGILSAHYEMAMGKTNGLGFNGLFSFWGTDVSNIMMIGAGAEYNWYFQNHALNGWFAGPHAQVTMASVNTEYLEWNDTYTEIIKKNDSASVVIFGIGGHGGYRWIWDNGFTLDLQVGITYNIGNSIKIGNVTTNLAGAGFSPGLNLGYAW